MKKKNNDTFEYYQEITLQGLVNAQPLKPEPKNRENKKEVNKVTPNSIKYYYTFTGSVYRYDKCIIPNFQKSTLAISEKQAKNNLLYQAKVLCNVLPSTGGFKLVGTLTKTNEAGN